MCFKEAKFQNHQSIKKIMDKSFFLDKIIKILPLKYELMF